MATVTWLIKKNADAPASLDTLGVTSLIPAFKTNGVDALTFVQSNDWLAAPLWPYGTKVALIQRTVDGGVTTDVCRFVGTVEGIPRDAVGAGAHSLAYTAFNAAYDLQRCDYSQEWTYTKDDGTTAQIYEPTVVIGEDNNGTRLTSGQVVAHVASYAVSRGVLLDLGTINAGVAIPLDERDNIKCWDAIVCVLSYTPDFCLWWDYNHQVGGVYVPALNLTAPDDMPVVTKALVGADAEGAKFIPRNDIRTPGVQIIYRWTGEYDGRTVKSRVIEQAGDCESFKRVSLVFDLEGSRSVFITQDVEVEDYPADWTSAAGEAFVLARIPRLPWPKNDNWWNVVNVTRSGAHGYPAFLKSGAVPEWTGAEVEDETFTVEIEYQAVSDDTGNVLDQATQKLTFNAKSTNAVTKTYRKMTEWVEAEPVPAGLAAALLASWNRLHFDGSVTFHDQECPFDLLPGMRLSCTGGLVEWETMNAIVQDVSMDLAKGVTSVRVGTCGRLQADNLLAVYRAARGRRFSSRRIGRDSGDASNGNQIEGAKGTPNDLVSDGRPPSVRKYLGVEAKNATDILHRVEIDPGNLQTSLSVQENTAQTFKLRPMELMVNDGPDANGNARVAVYKTYALMAAPAFDRHDTLSDIPEATGGGNYTGLNSVSISEEDVISLLGDAADAAGIYCAYATGGAPVRVWASPSGSVIIAANGSARIVRLEGDSDAPSSGSDQLIYTYDRSPTADADKKRKWIKIGANGGLKVETTSGSEGLRLAGTSSTAPSNGSVWGYIGASNYGWIAPCTLTINA